MSKEDCSFSSGFKIIPPTTTKDGEACKAEQAVPFLFNFPHSGRNYSAAFRASSRLSALTLRSSEDAYLDHLYDFCPSLGATMLIADFPRAFLDVNREPFELDSQLILEPLPDFANDQSLRVAGGLGTIARVVGNGQEIYHRPPTLAQALQRIEKFYFPFHRALKEIINEMINQHQVAYIIDCHSMPSACQHSDQTVQDIILGDLYGRSCEPRFINRLENLLQNCGYRTAQNKPYAGGFITENYGAPYRGVHVLQLEINRALYMDETSMKKKAEFDDLKINLNQIFLQLIADLYVNPSFTALAAE